MTEFQVRPVGVVRSSLTVREEAPRQGLEGGVEARIELDPAFLDALEGIRRGDDVFLITWLHEADRATLRVHPRGDPDNALTGVFATRSPDRPNPIGLHRVRVRSVSESGQLGVAPLEAIDGTPVLDIKPVLSCEA